MEQGIGTMSHKKHNTPTESEQKGHPALQSGWHNDSHKPIKTAHIPSLPFASNIKYSEVDCF